MKYVSDYLNITPLMLNFATAVSTSAKVRIDRGGGGDFSIICQAGFCATDGFSAASTIADLSATDAGNAITFTVVEATAASAAGSAISGATLDLGPSTVAVSRGGVMSIIQMTTANTTTLTVTINGISYNSSIAGPGSSGETVAVSVAKQINGSDTANTTSHALPHYEAIANDLATGLVTIRPKDEYATGITIATTAAGSDFVVFPGFCQGVINVPAARLSTNTPKYIGVLCGESTGTVVRAVHLVRTAGNFPGAVVTVT